MKGVSRIWASIKKKKKKSNIHVIGVLEEKRKSEAKKYSKK